MLTEHNGGRDSDRGNGTKYVRDSPVLHIIKIFKGRCGIHSRR